MRTMQNQLSSRLLFLPLDAVEKVLLWLSYRGLKPVSQITVRRRGQKATSREQINRIRKWLDDADVAYKSERGNLDSWHVGKDRRLVELSAKLLHKLDFESECQSGRIFGFPEESVEAYAFNRNLKIGHVQIPVIVAGAIYFHPFLKNKYYSPYILYSVRADKVVTDTQIAKRWADCIRSEAPKLAKWYEKQVHKQKMEEIESGFQPSLAIKRSGQSTKEIINEYSREDKEPSGQLAMALNEYWLNSITDFQFSSICYEIKSGLTLNERQDVSFLNALADGENIYKGNRSMLELKDTIERNRRLRKWQEANK